MPLHDRETIRDQFDDCVFADRDLTRPVHKYRFPQQGTLPRDAFQLVSDELMLDGNARQNLATFCQTWEEPEVLRLMALSINKNMIDRDEYPQTAEIERRCVHMMADLWNAPEAVNTIGTSAIGSSEACMLAGMAAAANYLDTDLSPSARRLTAAGAVLFMASDTMLGFRKFVFTDPPPALETGVMATYTAAQFLLSEGAARA